MKDRNWQNVNPQRAESLLEKIDDTDPLDTMDRDSFETALIYVLDHQPTAKYIAKFEDRLHSGKIPYGTLKAYLTTYLK